MRSLFVGDIHATPEELADCAALMDLVESTALKLSVDQVVLLGDQHHTHNIIRAEVMAFYRARFKKWREVDCPWDTLALVGNHDYAGEGQTIHSMLMYDEIIQVVDKPHLESGVLYLPYFSDREAFLRAVKIGGKTLVCHQTFDGSRYENGFFATDGVSPELVPQTEIISGHIHTPQDFGKVTYIGAPRWRSLSDANVSRSIWAYNFDDEGNVLSKLSVTTDGTCRQIRYVLDTPDDPFDGVIDPSVDWRIDVRGPSEFVDERKKRWTMPGVKVRSFYTDQAVVRVKESEGIGTAFRTYLGQFKPTNGTAVDRLAAMAQERLNV